MGDTIDMAALWRLDAAGSGRFVAEPPGRGFLFGGLTMSLALRAAAETVDADRLVPKSLHAVFLRAGEWGPVSDLDVAVVHDSGSFAHRSVAVSQQGRPIASVTVSFHVADDGPDVQPPGPVGPGPDGLPARLAHLTPGPSPLELRLLGGEIDLMGVTSPVHPYWARPVGAVGSDPVLSAGAITFASDYMVIGTPFTASPGSPRPTPATRVMTLSHTVWFHRRVAGESWCRYDTSLRSLVGGRYLVDGTAHAEDGTLVASFAQEGIIREG